MAATWNSNTSATYGSGDIEVPAPPGSGGVIIGIPVWRPNGSHDLEPYDLDSDDYGTAVASERGGAQMKVDVYAVDDNGSVDGTWNRTGNLEGGVFVIRLDDATAAADVVVATAGSGFNTATQPETIAAADINDSDFWIITVSTTNQGDSRTHTSGNTGDTDFSEIHDADVGGSGWWAGQAHVCVWKVEGHDTSTDYTPGDITPSASGGVRTNATILVPISSGGGGTPVSFAASEGAAVAAGSTASVSAGTSVVFAASEGPAVAGGSDSTVVAAQAVTFVAGEGPAVAGGSSASVGVAAGVTFVAGEGAAVAAGSDVSVSAGASVTFAASEGAAQAGGSAVAVSVGAAVTFSASEGAAVAGGSSATVSTPVGVTVVASSGAAVAGGSDVAFVGSVSVTVSAGEGAAVAGGTRATVVVPNAGQKLIRRLAGWKNVFRASDPELRRTLDSLTEYTAKFGAGAVALLDTAQTVATGVWTTVVWEEVSQDTNNFWNVSAPSRLTVPDGYDGVYIVTGAVRFNSNSTGLRWMRVTASYQAGGDGSFMNNQFFTRSDGDTGSATMLESTQRMVLRAGDYVELEVQQSSGGDLDVVDNETRLELTRVGDWHAG